VESLMGESVTDGTWASFVGLKYTVTRYQVDHKAPCSAPPCAAQPHPLHHVPSSTAACATQPDLT
jgi:hypothetical protein